MARNANERNDQTGKQRVARGKKLLITGRIILYAFPLAVVGVIVLSVKYPGRLWFAGIPLMLIVGIVLYLSGLVLSRARGQWRRKNLPERNHNNLQETSDSDVNRVLSDLEEFEFDESASEEEGGDEELELLQEKLCSLYLASGEQLRGEMRQSLATRPDLRRSFLQLASSMARRMKIDMRRRSNVESLRKGLAAMSINDLYADWGELMQTLDLLRNSAVYAGLFFRGYFEEIEALSSHEFREVLKNLLRRYEEGPQNE